MDQVVIFIAMVVYGTLGIFIEGKDDQKKIIFWSISVIVECLVILVVLLILLISIMTYSSATLLIAIKLWLLTVYMLGFCELFYSKEIKKKLGK